MYKYNINITDEPDKNGFQPFMTAYILESDCNDSGLRPAVMICPGGGYECVCENWEGERYAMAYAAAGFDAVTVNYTTQGGGIYPCQIKQLSSFFCSSSLTMSLLSGTFGMLLTTATRFSVTGKLTSAGSM